MEEWAVCQRSWLYLEPIFSSDDIMQQLPVEGKRYQTMDRIWRKTMNNAHQDPKVRMSTALYYGYIQKPFSYGTLSVKLKYNLVLQCSIFEAQKLKKLVLNFWNSCKIYNLVSLWPVCVCVFAAGDIILCWQSAAGEPQRVQQAPGPGPEGTQRISGDKENIFPEILFPVRWWATRDSVADQRPNCRPASSQEMLREYRKGKRNP